MTTLAALFEKIITLDSAPQHEALSRIFTSQPTVTECRKPSDTFDDQSKLAKAAFPTFSQDQIATLAWEKTAMCLAPQLRQLLLLQDSSGAQDIRSKLKFADQAWLLGKSDGTTAAVAQVPSSSTACLEQKLASLEASIGEINAALRKYPPRARSPSAVTFEDEVCYYHRKFGRQAKKCTPPCRYHRRERHPNGRGAASP